MKTKIGINGFGRIGRNAFKIAFERPDLEIVAVNDLTDTKTLAYLLKHDSNYGAYQQDVSFDDENIIVNNQKIKVLAEKDPANLPWKDLGVELVIESTGRFTKKEDAELHLKAGAKRVVLSGPSKSDGVDTIVLGANEDKLPNSTPVISNASCTTNSLGMVMAILDTEFGVEKSLLTTVHSYTASQALQDAPSKDVREGRNAAENIVPTTTGAAKAVALTLPQLKDKFDGLSIRVPTPVVSLSDVTALLKKDVTVDEVNAAFKKAAADPYYQGILGVSEEPLVSSDYIGNSHSGIVDLLLTKVVAGNLVKIMIWYDNEWGYSNRLVELTADIARLLQGNPETPSSASVTPVASEENEPKTETTPTPSEEKPEEPTSVPHLPGSTFVPSEPMLPEPKEAHTELLSPPPSPDEEDSTPKPAFQVPPSESLEHEEPEQPTSSDEPKMPGPISGVSRF
jgi:glyceraldehyde 3-phosphate dehydrogenase